MPTDQHGVTHAGALGLFDDVDENNAAAERSERHERECLETVIRREYRRAGPSTAKKPKLPDEKSEGGPYRRGQHPGSGRFSMEGSIRVMIPVHQSLTTEQAEMMRKRPSEGA
jgi:hypothetical protein